MTESQIRRLSGHGTRSTHLSYSTRLVVGIIGVAILYVTYLILFGLFLGVIL